LNLASAVQVDRLLAFCNAARLAFLVQSETAAYSACAAWPSYRDGKFVRHERNQN